MTALPVDQDPHEEPPICATCGRLHYRDGRRTCTAHGKTSKLPCMTYPYGYAKVCRMHGGAAPQVQSAGEWEAHNRDVRRKAAAALSTWAEDPPPPDMIDPVGELLVLVWRASRAERFWAARVAELEIPEPGEHSKVMIVGEDDDAQPMEVLGDATAIIGPDRWGELRVHPYVLAWNQERERLTKISKAALDAGIDERMTRLAEDQGALVADLFRRVIDAIEVEPGVALSPWARNQAIEVAGRELRGLA